MDSWPTILLAGVLGVSASFPAFTVIRDWERGKLQVRFRLAAEERSNTIRAEFRRNAEMAGSIEALFASSSEVTHREFQSFVVRVSDTHQDLVSAEWMPRRPGPDRDGFPTEYSYDFAALSSPLGLDRFSSAPYRRIMELARDEGREISLRRQARWEESGSVRDTELLEVFLPIYKPGQPVETVDDRRDNLAGFAMVSFDIGKTVEEAYRFLSRQGLDVVLEDVTEPGRPAVCWVQPSRMREKPVESRQEILARVPPRRGDSLRWDATWSSLGRVWKVRCLPAPGFVLRNSLRDSWLVLLLCLLITALGVERLWTSYRRAVRVERLVEQRTRELSLANRKMERVNQLKNEFVAQASHELRTPLTVMREGIAQLSDGFYGKPTPDQAEVLQVMLRNCDRLGKLMKDLLDLSKLESGNLPLQKSPFDLAVLAREACDRWRPQIAEKGLRLVLRLPNRMVAVNADREKIAQVISNLIRNALKFTEQGQIEVSVEQNGSGAVFGVADSGPGIPPDQVERLFQKFEQLEPVGSELRKGAGLGLAISKGIVDEHGGKIWVESVRGRGARFMFSLPNHSEVMNAA